MEGPRTTTPTVLALHESGASGSIWEALGEALADQAIFVAPDRPGWGETEPPECYARTTVAEQAGFAARALGERDAPAIVCGSGIGAVVALELALAEPGRVGGVVLIEPPLLSFVPEATEQLALDVKLIRETLAEGGRGAVLRAYVSGRFPALGPGAGRIPPRLRQRAVTR